MHRVRGWLLSMVLVGTGLAARAQEPEALELPPLAPQETEELPAPALLPPDTALPVDVDGKPLVTIPAKETTAPPKLWSGSLELGLNGADGNSDLFKVRSGAKAVRETENYILTVEAMYAYANANFEPTENRGAFSTRSEWPLKATPWSLFTSGQVQYDDFTAWRVLLNAHAGVGYEFCKTESTLLKARLGTGAAREVFGPNNQVKPEALVGGEVEKKIGSRQKLCAACTIFPDISALREFRAEAKVSYELLIDPEWNLTLKVGGTDRYLSNQPPGKRANDVEYFAMLLWRF